MEYIETHAHGAAPEGCVFCTLLEQGDPDGERILHRGERAFVTLAKYPYNPGHLLVLPIRHTAELEDVEPEEAQEIHRLLQRCLKALRAVSEPHGFNVGLNLGEAAGAGIAAHLHWHLVPRWQGDTNFMPVLADVRVMPQHLNTTWKLLRDAWETSSEEPTNDGL